MGLKGKDRLLTGGQQKDEQNSNPPAGSSKASLEGTASAPPLVGSVGKLFGRRNAKANAITP